MGKSLDPFARAFFDMLASEDKVAVDLSAETRSALGTDSAPDELDELEAAAVAGEPMPEETTEPAAEERGADVGVDAEPPAADGEEAEPIDGKPAEGDVPVEAPPVRAAVGKLFSDRRAHPMRLYDVLTARYSDEWLFWEPETLWWAIRRDFGPVGELTRNKLQALRLAATSYSPWADFDVFEKCGLAWNDHVPVFGAWQPMTPSQVAFTVQVLRELHPEAPWSHEAAAYEAAVLDENGFVYAPEEWFPGAQALLDRNPENAAFRDEVKGAWEKLGDQDASSLEWRADHPLDIHIARLFVVKTYLAERAKLRSGDPLRERSRATAAQASPPVP
jgi:hypothetical protein